MDASLQQRIAAYLDEEKVRDAPYREKVVELAGGAPASPMSVRHLQKIHLHYGRKNSVSIRAYYDFVGQPLCGIAQYDWFQPERRGIAWSLERICTGIAPAYMSLIDVGCGTGIAACFLAQEYPRLSVTGIDRSESMVKSARRRKEKYALQNVSFETKNFEGLKDDTKEYDIVLCMNALCEDVLCLSNPADKREIVNKRMDALFRHTSSRGELIVIDWNPLRAEEMTSRSGSVKMAPSIIMDFCSHRYVNSNKKERVLYFQRIRSTAYEDSL